MLSSFFKFLFGDVPVEISSFHSLEESAQRLQRITHNSFLSTLFKQSAVGSVKTDSISLHRFIPFFGNSFKPVFLGRLDENNGLVVLKGKFTMHLFSKVFMTIWLSLALLWTLLTTLAAIGILLPINLPSAQPHFIIFFPFMGLGFFYFGILFVRFGWWLSRGDMDYLSSILKQALQSSSSDDSQP